MAELDWKVVEGVSTVPKEHCFEADVANGKYRVAPWLHVDRSIHYEAFFIPTGAESMAIDRRGDARPGPIFDLLA
jgi:hypothetical protein